MKLYYLLKSCIRLLLIEKHAYPPSKQTHKYGKITRNFFFDLLNQQHRNESVQYHYRRRRHQLKCLRTGIARRKTQRKTPLFESCHVACGWGRFKGNKKCQNASRASLATRRPPDMIQTAVSCVAFFAAHVATGLGLPGLTCSSAEGP